MPYSCQSIVREFRVNWGCYTEIRLNQRCQILNLN
jgi:hypothetical protein